MRRLLTIIAVFLVTAVTAQQKTVTGVVSDASTNNPLQGATVHGKSQTAVTDANGNFSLLVNDGEQLTISFVGMESVTLPVPASGNLTVKLTQTAGDLNQVVVVGYQTQRKVDLVGAVAVVDMKPVKNSSSGNPMQALQGRVAGLYVEKNGSPNGENSRILIRGSNTLNNTDPLYVIDGVPTKNPAIFQSITGGSIESVQILKDASAASIYGARASNGVIIVTTRNGSSANGKMTIQFNSGWSMQTVQPQKLPMLDAEGRGVALWQASVNDKTDPNAGYPQIYQYDWNGNYDKPVLNKVLIQPYVGGDTTEPVGNTDWQSVVYDNALISSNELTISGGTKNSSALISLGYFNNAGVLAYTDYERYSVRINAATQFFNGKLKFGINSQFASSNQTLPTTDLGGAPTPGLAITLAPTIPVYKTDGSFAGPQGGGYSDRNNPLNMQYLNRWDNTNRSFAFGNFYVDAQIIKDLTFRSNLGVEYNTGLVKDYQLAFQEGFLGRSINSFARSTNRFLALTWSNTLNYQHEFGKHRISVLAGVEAIDQSTESFGAYREGFAQQTKDYFVIDAGSGNSTNFGNASSSRLLSQFGKVNYSYEGKYLASFTLRRDGSSRFGADNRYGIFPAANVGWRIKSEDFMQGMNAVSDLKLRAGIGRVGNQDIGDFPSLGLYRANYGTIGTGFPGSWLNTGTAYDLGGINQGSLPSGFVSVQGANPALRWETTEELNIGLDFGFFNQKLYGSFDYFSRKIFDILIQPPVASAVGEGHLKWVNGATKENKGFELVIGYHNQTKRGLSYTIQGNLASFHDKITELPEEVRTAYPGNSQQTILGHSEQSIFGYQTAGLFQTQGEVDAAPYQVGKGLGRIKYVDRDGNDTINSYDQTWLGTVLPKYEYGIRIDLAYKSFDLSLFGSGVSGRHGNNSYLFFNNFARPRENAGPGVLNGWTPENPNTKTPALTLVDVNTESKASDYFLINTSYFKLRNIQLGYTLPKGVQSWHMSQLRFYAMCDNVFWLKNKDFEGKDPEVVDLNLIPTPTTYTLGVNITFE
jgi:TonB-linked SusC/RagA family outer membrane protein